MKMSPLSLLYQRLDDKSFYHCLASNGGVSEYLVSEKVYCTDGLIASF